MRGHNGDYVEAYHALTGEHFVKAGCMATRETETLDWLQ